jgi:hypothetical protein
MSVDPRSGFVAYAPKGSIAKGNAQTLLKVQMPNRNGFIPRFPERLP